MNKLFILATVVGLAACNQDKDATNFEVEGTVKNTTAKMIYLEEIVPNSNNPVIMDSSEIKANGSFDLDAQTKEESFYQLRLQNQLTPFVFLINDVNKLKVNADLNNATQPYTVDGSPASKGLMEFDRTTFQQGLKIYTLGSKVDSLRKAAAPDSVVAITYKELEDAATSFKTEAQAFIQKSNSPILSLYTLSSFQNRAANLNMVGFSQEEMKELINTAATKHPKHTALQSVKSRMNATEAPKAGFTPRKAPEFSQPDVNGKPISLASFKGKYVLLDFWASWCKPCRVENPNVVKAYNQFKDKNFTVFGVSLDENKDAWLQAIQKDGLTWPHASDLQSWNNAAAALYEVQSIPANFLIDPQGNIIAQDLRGEELMETLARFIK
ncbi:MAG TPA: TlpA disulfide reductase family protein [Flavisolibacter sp.]|nr:TlpA disulfide reductase family protein [Flavisolibacter sp.]